MTRTARILGGLLCVTATLGWRVAAVQAEVTIDWVAVGDPGNADDVQPFIRCYPEEDRYFGSVAYDYCISKYEVTNTQYVEFLNAVAATDTYGLYDTRMGLLGVISVPPDESTYYGGITRSGSSGSYTYSPMAGRESLPVNHVSFWDALRFANWLHNGQPSGVQDNSTTEDGAYTITAQGMADNSITRNARATCVLPSEDEWYKAAYYDALSTSYFDYPAGSDVEPFCTDPSTMPNTANCCEEEERDSSKCARPPVPDLTNVGSYTGSASPNGTFDQGGNVWEWNDSIKCLCTDAEQCWGRGVRGGGFVHVSPPGLSAAWEGTGDVAIPDVSPCSADTLGFRVASLDPELCPEPGARLLGVTSILVLAAVRKRRA